jgi:arylsulfatase A-like enzyme
MREPTIAWWPGKVPAGTATDEITGMFDVLPTFVHLAGANVPTDRKIDGGDIWPVLAGQPGAKSPHDVFYYFKGLALEGVRSGPWKLRFASAGLGEGKGPVKKLDAPAQDQLYNLETDLGESKDVSAEHADVMAHLRALADAMNADLGVKGSGPGVRPLGRVANPRPLIGLDGTIRPEFAPK